MQAMENDLSRVANIADEHRRVFAAMLTALDDSVGTLLTTLRELRVEKDTLVFLVSDNGGPTAELTSSNGPLRGGKGQLFEGGIRVPFFARWPDRIPAALVFNSPVTTLDLAPTALAAAGVKDAADLDGVDLLPYWRSETKTPPHAVLYWRYGSQFALRSSRWKLVQAGKGNESPQLFDLDADPNETINLAPRESERVAELLQAWRKIDAEMVPPIR
jgi:arylsulfatase B